MVENKASDPTVEPLFQRIAQLLCFGLSLREIHDRCIEECGGDEGLFFLAYKAASRIAQPLEFPLIADPFGDADTLT